VVGKIRTNNLVDRRIEMPFISRAKMLKRSWFNIADTPGCCCPYDASWCVCKCWRTFYLSFRSKDTEISALFRTRAGNVSACCSSCWTSRCTADRSISPYARLLGNFYGILKKKTKSRSRSVKVCPKLQNLFRTKSAQVLDFDAKFRKN